MLYCRYNPFVQRWVIRPPYISSMFIFNLTRNSRDFNLFTLTLLEISQHLQFIFTSNLVLIKFLTNSIIKKQCRDPNKQPSKHFHNAFPHSHFCISHLHHRKY